MCTSSVGKMMAGYGECWLRPGRLLLFFLWLLLASCAARPVPLHEGRPVVVLQWPSAPEPARIEWVKTIADYRDAGISEGVWQKLAGFFTGQRREGLVRPHGLLYDGAERLFVADPGAGIVHQFDLKNGRYRVIGRDPGIRLISPIGLAEDDQEHLFITDSAAGKVYRYDLREDRLEAFLVIPLERPTGIVWNRHNRLLYIVDTLGATVVAVNDRGEEQLRIGGAPNAETGFNHPTDIWADAAGRLYVTDSLNFSIKIFTPTGEPDHQFGEAGDTFGTLNKPKGLATDSQGHLYVCDALHDAIQIFDDSGRLLLAFGTRGTGNGEFWMPSGIFIDQRDFIFVADTYNRRVQVFRYRSEAAAGTGAAPAKAGKQP